MAIFDHGEEGVLEMGYYNGSGVVGGGGTRIDVLEAFPYYGTHHIHQKVKTVNTRFPGVSLATAQDPSNDGWCVMHTFEAQVGWGTYYAVDAYGTKRSSSYSQIGDSQLYELVVTDETYQANLDSGAWVGP